MIWILLVEILMVDGYKTLHKEEHPSQHSCRQTMAEVRALDMNQKRVKVTCVRKNFR